MSASIVRKSLAIVDSDFRTKGKSSKKNKIKKSKEISQITQKVTVTEIRKKSKTKDQILKENLEKLKLIKQMCSIDLDEEITRKIIERGATRKPIQIREKPKVPEKTAFTEEDFIKFEQEYFNE